MTFYTRDMGHVWSGGGALSQWARHDPKVNKKTTSLYWRGHACIWLIVDTTRVKEPRAMKWHSVGVLFFLFLYIFSRLNK